MQDQVIAEEKPNNKNRTLIIIVVAVVILCCCLVIAAAVGFYSFTAIRSVESSSGPIDDVAPQSDYDSSNPPVGGLGNDILKNDTWQTMVPVAMGFGCTPVSEDSSIEVLQEPDGGIWVEKWAVACTSGDSLDFEVEFILDDTGATYNITPLQ